MRTLIIVLANDNAMETYTATIEGMEYQGASPDEALGYAVRELSLAGVFDAPVKLTVVH